MAQYEIWMAERTGKKIYRIVDFKSQTFMTDNIGRVCEFASFNAADRYAKIRYGGK